MLFTLAVVVLAIAISEYRNATPRGAVGRSELPAAAALMRVSMPPGVPHKSVEYHGFEMSFNPDEHVPNWVAWELDPSEVDGAIGQHKTFAQDKNVDGCPTLDDYKRSGYDRGHIAPAADMKWSEESRRDCYYLTNMCPQEHNFNANVWGRLESTCRNWALRDSSLIIIAGPVLADGVDARIGASGVAVPKRFFKVILEPYHDPVRAIGFLFPNGDAPGGMQTHVVSVDEVEAATGYDFFAALPDSIENVVESVRWSFADWAVNARDRRSR